MQEEPIQMDLQILKKAALSYEETVTPLLQGKFVPTLNGGLVYLGPERIQEPRKLVISIKTQTGVSKAFFRRGGVYHVDLTETIREAPSSTQKDNGYEITPSEAWVPGSLKAWGISGAVAVAENQQGFCWGATPMTTVCYRPRLFMQLMDYKKHIQGSALVSQIEWIFQEIFKQHEKGNT
jgi:hypothetical protein